MEKEKNCISLEDNYDDDMEVLVAPYYLVTYKDDWGLKHLAMIKDEAYLEFLKDRFVVLSSQLVEA